MLWNRYSTKKIAPIFILLACFSSIEAGFQALIWNISFISLFRYWPLAAQKVTFCSREFRKYISAPKRSESNFLHLWAQKVTFWPRSSKGNFLCQWELRKFLFYSWILALRYFRLQVSLHLSKSYSETFKRRERDHYPKSKNH